MSIWWLNIAKEIQALAQSGLEFSDNKYDIDRYKQLREISVRIMHEMTAVPMQKIRNLFANEQGYCTPKVDIRSVVFRENKILMVRESIDGCWSLPGGWADVNYSPYEIAAKEVFEEAGIRVTPTRILAVFDKSKHEHPPDKFHVYKLFILCDDSTFESVKPGMETTEAGWFPRNGLPPLSLPRITANQISIMFQFYDNPLKETLCE